MSVAPAEMTDPKHSPPGGSHSSLPAPEPLGLEGVTITRVLRVSSWTARDTLRRPGGWGVVAALTLIIFLVINLPWPSLLSTPLADVGPLAWARLERASIASILAGIFHTVGPLVGYAVLVLLGFWLVHVARWAWTATDLACVVYFDADVTSVLVARAVPQASPTAWLLSGHAVARRGQGYGARLREGLVNPLGEKAHALGIALSATTPNSTTLGIFARQFPHALVSGRSLTWRPAVHEQSYELGRNEFPGRVAEDVRRRIAGGTHGTVGAIVAPWGSGKTWALDRVAPLLEFPDRDVPAIRVIHFNPWMFADAESMFAGFAEVTLGQIASRRARKRAATALRLVGPSSKFGPVDLSAAASDLGESLDPPVSPGSLRRFLSEGLTGDKRKVCIVMDDVDRLSADELIMLFKLIRLVGSIPGVFYLLCYDEETVLHLLTQTDIARDDPRRAASYLEKIVETKHRIPPLTVQQVEELGLTSLLRRLDQHQMSIHPRSKETLEWLFSAALVPALSTVRSIERLHDEVDKLPDALAPDIDFKDWTLAAFLKTQMPQVWTYVVGHRREFVNGGLEAVEKIWSQQDGKEDPFARELPKNLEEMGLGQDDVTVAVQVLAAMFPALHLKETSIFTVSSTVDEAAERKGIGHDDYFDRYTWQGLPPSDFSDSRIQGMLRDLPRGPEANFTQTAATAEFNNRPEAVIRTIRRSIGDAQIVKPDVLYFLAAMKLEDDERAYFFGRRHPIDIDAFHLLHAMSPDERDEVFDWAKSQSAEANKLFDDLLTRGHHWQPGNPLHRPMSELLPLTVERLSNELRASPSPTVDEPITHAKALTLLQMAQDKFGSLAREMVATTRWRTDDTIALFITRFTNDLRGQTGVNGKRLIGVLGPDFVASAYPLNGITEAAEGFLVDDEGSYLPVSVEGMRETASGAVAQLWHKQLKNWKEFESEIPEAEAGNSPSPSNGD